MMMMRDLMMLPLGLAAGLMLTGCTAEVSTTNATAQAPKMAAPATEPSFGRWKGDGTMYDKPSDDDLQQKLSPTQYRVTQHEGTERPFSNEFWDSKEDGIYVDVVSGEPLFASVHKYKSGTGWPSFYQALDGENIVEHTDRKLGMARTEVRSKHADSHLGHLFPDGPQPTGMRYCINSASLRFVPVERLAEEGYEKYLSLFEKDAE